MAKTLYQILGVAPTASADDIQAAYSQLAERVPPLDAVQRMAVKEAFGTLHHPQRRAAYDASLHGGGRAQAPAAVAAEPASRKPLWLGLALLLLAAGGWALRPHKAPAAAAQRVEWVTPQAAAQPVAAGAAASAPAARALSAEQLFARLSPSVVRVNALSEFGESTAFGSGVVVDSATVVTNCHVARQGVKLRVKHQAEQFQATLTTADEAHDLCKLSVPGLAAPAVALGRVANLRVGQKVYAIGSPQGLDLTLSDGMVSSLREGPDGTFVQTTAPISPGSSGGGLFDETGTLVGIVTFQFRAGQNLNFAVPADWIVEMRNTTDSPPERDSAAPAAPPMARVDTQATLILGRWACFGPLTGRGVELRFDSDGSVGGSFNGKPISGRYVLHNGQLSLMDEQFHIEQLDSTRMVLAQSQGRRLACNH
jgi:serine protease Do